MNIVQLTPGSGEGFYCENCLRDKEIVRALRALGHQVLLVPLYLPVAMEERYGPAGPIFFGGLNVYLQQKSALFRRTPRWIDRLLDAPGLLRRLGRLAGMTRPGDLGEATLSMLDGESGRQRKELDRLAAWLAEGPAPDVICLSNALLVGGVRRMKEALGRAKAGGRSPPDGAGVKVACLLQDEDEFVDALPPAYRDAAWEKMARRAGDVDVFVAVSRHFADAMRQRLRLPAEKVRVVYPGVAAEDYSSAAAPPQPPVVGFLSRMCRDKGLDLLVEAFLILKADERLKGLRLRAAGGQTRADDEYLAGIGRRLAGAGALTDVELLPNLDGTARREFLSSLSVLCVPERRGEAAGFYILEALASGVPVVQPPTGVSPELIEATGGGILSASGEPAALAEALRKVLLDETLRAELARRGRQAAANQFHVNRTAKELAAIFEEIAKSG